MSEHDGYGSFGSSLRDLPRLRTGRRGRASSWDRSGGNDDFIRIRPGETASLLDLAGAGSIDHIWMTTHLEGADKYSDSVQKDYLRRLVLRMRWDGEDAASVQVPLGDFFGSFASSEAQFASLPLVVGPAQGRSMTSWWHMPFADGARIEVTSELDHHDVGLYFYVDYESFARLEPGLGRFHAQWRRENPCDGIPRGTETNYDFLNEGVNLEGLGNYTILEAVGRGHYVGCILAIHNLRRTNLYNWYGEGDDMIFVDGARWPPTLHGTGTEDYFDTAYCPNEPFSAPYTGLIQAGGENWSGVSALYRFHVEDPIAFRESIRVTIEHGHANKRSDDLTSVAYWYQAEPHSPFGLAPVTARIALSHSAPE